MRIILSLLLLTLINFDLSAHAYLEDPEWCESGQTVSIGNVYLSLEELQTNLDTGVMCSISPIEAETFPISSSHRKILNFISPVIFTPNTNRDHGILDLPSNQYQSAIAYSYCACSSLNGSETIDPSEVRSEVSTTQLSGSSHHTSYSYAHGLSFSCNACLVDESIGPGN